MLDLAIQQARVQQQQQAQRLTDGHNQPIPEDVDWEVQELALQGQGDALLQWSTLHHGLCLQCRA